MTDEEKADRWFEEHSEDSPSAVVKALAALLRQVREEERGACARECEAFASEVARQNWAVSSAGKMSSAVDCARRIRARGSR